MNRQWAISIRQPYVECIVARRKAFEIRTRIPSDLSIGDEVYVVQVGSGGKVVMSFVVGDILLDTPRSLWENFRNSLCVTEKDFCLYAAGRQSLYLLRTIFVKSVVPPLLLENLGLSRVPQWFVRVCVPHSAPPC
jgi:predicted transcriptional regulator